MQTTKARPVRDPNPWEDVTEDGSHLTVDQFVTTMIVQLGNSLRREVTTAYAEDVGLAVPEWRMLSLIAHAGRLPFGELVRQSAADKAMVSRTVRTLQDRGLCEIQPEPGGNRKRLVCQITESGMTLYEQVLPIAQRRQAELLALLTKKERVALYSALVKLRHACNSGPSESG
jgi:DNA-binding MarR family transcriptional regulator